MAEEYVTTGRPKSEVIAAAGKAIRESIAANHPGHKMEWFHLENGFEIWCLTCDEKAASAEITEVPHA